MHAGQRRVGVLPQNNGSPFAKNLTVLIGNAFASPRSTRFCARASSVGISATDDVFAALKINIIVEVGKTCFNIWGRFYCGICYLPRS